MIQEVMKNVEQETQFPVFVYEMEHYLVLVVVVLFFSILNIWQTDITNILCQWKDEEQQRRQQISTLLFFHWKSLTETMGQTQRLHFHWLGSDRIPQKPNCQTGLVGKAVCSFLFPLQPAQTAMNSDSGTT